jgi:hypothetical protein
MEFNGQPHTQGALTPRKDPWYLWNRRLVEPQSRSGQFGEVKNILLLLGLEPRKVKPVALVIVLAVCLTCWI